MLPNGCSHYPFRIIILSIGGSITVVVLEACQYLLYQYRVFFILGQIQIYPVSPGLMAQLYLFNGYSRPVMKSQKSLVPTMLVLRPSTSGKAISMIITRS